jgi:hypothetical protein
MTFYTNDHSPIKGSGLGHRRGSVGQRAEIALDILEGVRPYVPTTGEVQRALRVPGPVLREHRKARVAGNGNGHSAGNGNNGHCSGDVGHSAPPAPAADRYIVDRRLSDLIGALDEVIGVLVDLRDRQST